MRVLIRAKDPVKMTEYKLGMVPIDLADVLHRWVAISYSPPYVP